MRERERERERDREREREREREAKLRENSIRFHEIQLKSNFALHVPSNLSF